MRLKNKSDEVGHLKFLRRYYYHIDHKNSRNLVMTTA